MFWGHKYGNDLFRSKSLYSVWTESSTEAWKLTKLNLCLDWDVAKIQKGETEAETFGLGSQMVRQILRLFITGLKHWNWDSGFNGIVSSLETETDTSLLELDRLTDYF